MSDTITRLNTALEGRYQIDRKLGEGGMATVYLAEDLKHERRVALKVLKPELAALVGIERFLAEIKTTANLQHPHILPLYDSGEADGLLFYVMPYVQGESLRDRLDREHQLPIEDAVRIATNMAEALDYAHRQGVIHRDIKPANVLLLDGKPVISDFGIALALGAAGGARLTETGLSVGTPHYMSPEQATGDLHIGPATDIYAVGCVLYEMLVGEPPFTGSTLQAVLGRILTSDPPAVSEERSAPQHVDAVVRRALARVPADRFESGRAMAAALADRTYRWGPGEGASSAEVAKLRGLVRVTATAAVVVTVAFFWQVVSGPGADAERVAIYTSLLLPEGGVLDLGSSSQPFAVSADGRVHAFRVTGEEGESEVWVRRLDEPAAILVSGAEGAGSLVLSPDGEWIGFHHQPSRALRRIPVSGGEAEVVGPTGAEPGETFTGADWGPNGQIVASLGRGGLRLFPAPGRAPIDLDQILPSSPDSLYRYHEPRFLPDGRGLVVRRVASEPNSTILTHTIVVADFEGNAWPIVSGANPSVTPEGVLIYLADPFGNELWAAQLDADQRRLSGDPVRIAGGVSGGRYVLAADGTLVYAPTAGTSSARLLWVDREGSITPILDATDPQLPPGMAMRVGLSAARLSPDGGRVAFRAFYYLEEPQFKVFVFDLERRVVTPLSASVSVDWPVWTPDGTGLLVNRFMDDNSVADVYVAHADNAVPPRPFWPPTERLMQHVLDFTPDGLHLIYQQRDSARSRDSDIWLYSIEEEGAEVLIDGEGTEKQATVSPDGRWLAFVSNVSGQDEVYVVDFPGISGRRVKISNGVARSPVWSPDGQELFYMRADRTIMTVQVTLGDAFSASTPAPLVAGQFHPGYPHGRAFDISPDGERFLVGERSAGVTRLDLVQNWMIEVRRRLDS